MATEFRAPIQQMDERQKEWFATAMVSMVLADGNVTQTEADSLMNSLSFVQSPEALDRLKKYLQHKTMPNLPAFSGWSKNLKARALLLVDLLEVAISDRDLSPTERDQFYRIGKLLGFNAQQVEQFVGVGTQAVQNPE